MDLKPPTTGGCIGSCVDSTMILGTPFCPSKITLGVATSDSTHHCSSAASHYQS
jgi:hypothetical protein